MATALSKTNTMDFKNMAIQCQQLKANDGTAVDIDELTALSGTEFTALDGVTPGTVSASKALIVDASKDLTELGALGVTSIVVDGVTTTPLKWVDVTVTAAILDGAGAVAVIAGVAGDLYKIREVILVGGGTNFGGAGDRLIDLTDGTTVWTTIANADIETAPAASLRWGNAKVPFLTGTSDTKSVTAEDIRFEYSGGASDHTTGSIVFSVLLEKTD